MAMATSQPALSREPVLNEVKNHEADFTNGRMSSERNTTVIGLASGQIKTTTIRDETMVRGNRESGKEDKSNGGINRTINFSYIPA